MSELTVRLGRLRETLLEAGFEWQPEKVSYGLSVRREARLLPEVEAEIERVLTLLREVVARTTGAAHLEAFVGQCRRFAARCERDGRLSRAGRWQELADRTAKEGALPLEEAELLTLEECRELEVQAVHVWEPERWPPRGQWVPFGSSEVGRSYPVALPEPEPAHPPAGFALRGLRVFLEVWRAEQLHLDDKESERRPLGSTKEETRR